MDIIGRGWSGEPGSGTCTQAVSGRQAVERQPQSYFLFLDFSREHLNTKICSVPISERIMTKITVGLDEHNKVNGG